MQFEDLKSTISTIFIFTAHLTALENVLYLYRNNRFNGLFFCSQCIKIQSSLAYRLRYSSSTQIQIVRPTGRPQKRYAQRIQLGISHAKPSNPINRAHSTLNK